MSMGRRVGLPYIESEQSHPRLVRIDTSVHASNTWELQMQFARVI